MSGDKKSRFGLFKILGIVIALLVAAIIAIPFVLDANQFRPKLESELTRALGREVKVGHLRLSILSGGVAADDIAIADDPAFSRSHFVRAKSFRVGVELKPLIFSKSVRITGITLIQPEVNLIRSASGDWNFSRIGGKPDTRPNETSSSSSPASSNISVKTIEITGGRITVTRGGKLAKAYVYDKVNLQARNLSLTSVFPFTLTAVLPGGGNVKLEGKAGPMNITDASLTPFSANIIMKRFNLTASGFIEPASGLAGIIDFDGDLNSDGKQMQSKGRAQAEKLQLVKGGTPAAQPVSLEYAVNHNLKSESGTLNEAKIGLGKAVAHLKGSYDMHGESVVLKMKLRGENMPAPELEAMLPAIGVTLPKGASLQGGMLNMDLATEGPVEKMTTTGTVGILNTRLAGFDLGAKMATVASLAGIKSNSVTEIEKFASELQVTPEGIQASGLSLIVPALGQLAGDGTVGSNSSLDFKMMAKLKTSGGVVGSLTKLAGLQGSNELTVPFFIRGTTSNPAFIPDAKGIAGGLLKSATSGKDTKSGDSSSGQSLGDTLRGLLKPKKK